MPAPLPSCLALVLPQHAVRQPQTSQSAPPFRCPFRASGYSSCSVVTGLLTLPMILTLCQSPRKPSSLQSPRGHAQRSPTARMTKGRPAAAAPGRRPLQQTRRASPRPKGPVPPAARRPRRSQPLEGGAGSPQVATRECVWLHRLTSTGRVQYHTASPQSFTREQPPSAWLLPSPPSPTPAFRAPTPAAGSLACTS